MTSFEKFKNNIYSQNGEDGILEEILKRLKIDKGTFVEFGAWDGKYLSNTYNILEKGWEGVYIEGHKERFEELQKNMTPFLRKVELINKYVSIEKDNKLDNLLSKTRIKNNFDVLSIDVDSYDWHIWESLKNYKPKIVIIEINSNIPVGIYQTHRGDKISGSSFTSTVELGKRKGYTLVCHTGNLFFVRNELIVHLNLPEIELFYPEILFNYKWVKLSFYKKSQIGLIKILKSIFSIKK